MPEARVGLRPGAIFTLPVAGDNLRLTSASTRGLQGLLGGKIKIEATTVGADHHQAGFLQNIHAALQQGLQILRDAKGALSLGKGRRINGNNIVKVQTFFGAEHPVARILGDKAMRSGRQTIQGKILGSPTLAGTTEIHMIDLRRTSRRRRHAKTTRVGKEV